MLKIIIKSTLIKTRKSQYCLNSCKSKTCKDHLIKKEYKNHEPSEYWYPKCKELMEASKKSTEKFNKLLTGRALGSLR